MLKALLVIGSLVFLGVILYLFYFSIGQGFGFGTAPEQRTRLLWLSGLAMVLGVIGSALTAQLKLAQSPISIAHELRKLWTSPGLYQSLVASPLLFATIYTAADKQPDMVIGLLTAFQTGFMCEALLAKRIAENT